SASLEDEALKLTTVVFKIILAPSTSHPVFGCGFGEIVKDAIGGRVTTFTSAGLVIKANANVADGISHNIKSATILRFLVTDKKFLLMFLRNIFFTS
ncbi:MAG: hypothetical protein WCD17_18110, partial [Acinetobacter calcoaceticus]